MTALNAMLGKLSVEARMLRCATSSASRWPRSRAAAAEVRTTIDDARDRPSQSAIRWRSTYPIFYVKRPVVRADCAKPTEQRTAEPGIRHRRRFVHALDASLSALRNHLTKDITKNPWATSVGTWMFRSTAKRSSSQCAFQSENQPDRNQPGWSIWEYDITTATCEPSPATRSLKVRKADNDRYPHYLPDDRMCFRRRDSGPRRRFCSTKA